MPGNTCWKACSGCCCEDLDFAYLRGILMSHAHALDRAMPRMLGKQKSSDTNASHCRTVCRSLRG